MNLISISRFLRAWIYGSDLVHLTNVKILSTFTMFSALHWLVLWRQRSRPISRSSLPKSVSESATEKQDLGAACRAAELNFSAG